MFELRSGRTGFSVSTNLLISCSRASSDSDFRYTFGFWFPET